MCKKFNKLTSLLLALTLIIGVMSIAPFSVSAATYGDYEYRLEDDYTCTITKYNGSASNVTIPSTIYGNKVTTIASRAFQDNNNLKSVTVPDSVAEIRHSVFEGCKNLSSVKLPSKMKSIGDAVFAGTAINSLTLPTGIDELSYRLCSACEKLTSVTIPNTVTKIGEDVFQNCASLQSLNIPNNVEEIDYRFADGCSSLKSVTIGTGLEEILYQWDFIFSDCPSLENITVSSGNNNFSSASGVLYDKNKTKILRYPQGKKNTDYTVPNTVKEIKQDTFTDNTYLKTITIYDNVQEIQNYSVGYIGEIWNYKKISGFTIKGYRGTEAEKYARNNDFNFVELQPTSVALNKSSITLGVGESYTLTKTVSPPNVPTSYTWSSSNTSVATVNSSGKITAKGTGTANITVKTSNGKTATCKVTVKKAPTSVSLNKTSVTLKVGQTYDLNSKLPSGCASYSVKYTSNNTKVATVKASGGLVTAKAKGTATITATTYNGKKATCKVTVK